MYSFNVRVVLSCVGVAFQITGGSSGIGKCLAAAAVQRGASVVTLVARNKVNNRHCIHSLNQFLESEVQILLC